MSMKYIIETQNQIWGVYSYEGKYPVALYQRGESRHATLHQFTDLAIASQALADLRTQRGGAKLKVYRLLDNGDRQEVQP